MRIRRWTGWLYRECLSLLVSAFVVAMGFVLLANLADSLLSRDPSARILAGFVISAVLWLYALFGAQTLAHSPDEALFAFTPLTARRYFFRNLRLSWAQHVMAFIGLPLAAAVVWRYLVPEAMRQGLDWQPLTLVNGVAAYYAMVLGALAQATHGPALPTNWLFVTRHVFRRFTAIAVGIVILAGAANWLTGGAVLDALHTAADRLLDLGGVGFVILALLSPVSAIVVQEFPGIPQQAAVLAGGLWLTSVGWSGFAIVYALMQPMAQWEREMYDSWLDARRDVEEQEEQAAEEEETALDAWAAKTLWTYADDVADADPGGKALPYDESPPPEDQVLRDARFAITRDEAESTSLAGRIAARALQHPWATMIVLLWIAWPWTVASGRYEIWPGKIALFLALVVGFFANAWWTDALTSGLALPICLARIVPKAFWIRWLRYTLPCDALAVALWAVALGVPVLPALSILGVLQLMRVAGAMHSWADLVESTGSHQVLKLVDLVAAALTIVVGLMTVMILPTEDDPRIFEKLPIHIAAYLGAGSLVAVYALLLLWTHRRADSTLPQHHTSYAQADAD